MKVIVLILGLLLVTVSPASAQLVVVTWQFEGEADGFTIYWGDLESPTVTYNGTVKDGTAREYAVEANRFIPQHTYRFQMESYNGTGSSGPSNIFDYLHDVTAYEPPEDNLPPAVEVPEIPPPPAGMEVGGISIQYVPIKTEGVK